MSKSEDKNLEKAVENLSMAVNDLCDIIKEITSDEYIGKKVREAIERNEKNDNMFI